MAKIGFEAKVTLTPAFIKSTNETFVKIFQQRIQKRKQRIFELVYREIVKEIKKTLIYKELASSIMPADGRSLRAELGLTNALAKEAADEILYIVEQLLPDVKLSKTKAGKDATVTAEIAFPDPVALGEALKTMDSGSYTSTVKSGSTEIYWMEWLIEKAVQPLDKFGKKWAITYDLKPRKVKTSRSGLAVMISRPEAPTDTTKRGNPRTKKGLARARASYNRQKERFDEYGTYKLPAKYLKTGKGLNFIDQIFYDKTFIESLKDKVSKEISKIIRED